MIHLDTCVLVDALTGPRRSAPALRALFEEGERVSFSTLVLYEWLRGPRRAEELRVQEALFPASEAAPFDRAEAALARHRSTAPRPRSLPNSTDTSGGLAGAKSILRSRHRRS